MKTPAIVLSTIAAVATLSAYPAAAAVQTETKQELTAISAIAVGAIAGGPIGALAGIVAGSWFSAEAGIADTTLRDVKVSGSQGITDGFIGARIRVPFSERWSGTFRFDVGQGDSDFSRQAMAMANYHITDRWTSSIGYRNLSVDYKDGDFMFDTANEGVQVASLYQL